jgi:hypothetical protein
VGVNNRLNCEVAKEYLSKILIKFKQFLQVEYRDQDQEKLDPCERLLAEHADECFI